MKAFEKWSVAWALGGVLGCGGGNGSGGRVDTGLPDTLVLRDVTSAQAVPACESVRSAIETQFSPDQNVRRACELYGAALTQTTSDCQTQADRCVSQTDDGTNAFFSREDLDFGASLACDGDVSGFQGCDVTVGEYESCMDARIDQVEALFASFTCADAASIELGDAQGLVRQLSQPEAQPAACERLQAECPQAGPFPGAEN